MEWSSYEDFHSIEGHQIIDDPQYTFYAIPGLVQGNKYYVQVRAWNIKGFGESSAVVSATPTSEYQGWFGGILVLVAMKGHNSLKDKLNI